MNFKKLNLVTGQFTEKYELKHNAYHKVHTLFALLIVFLQCPYYILCIVVKIYLVSFSNILQCSDNPTDRCYNHTPSLEDQQIPTATVQIRVVFK